MLRHSLMTRRHLLKRQRQCMLLAARCGPHQAAEFDQFLALARSYQAQRKALFDRGALSRDVPRITSFKQIKDECASSSSTTGAPT